MGAHIISVTDGTTTLNLHDGTATMILSYEMPSPVVDQTVIAGAQDGMNLSTPTWGNAEGTIELLVFGATVDAVRATINSLEAIIDRARQNALTWGNARCFIQAQIDGETDVWRSEILAGRVTVQEPLDGTWKKKMHVTLQLTRRYFWEGPRTAVYMSSVVTAETTSPVTWHNGADDIAGQRNYLHIAANRVTGVLPAPLELRLVYGGTSSNVRNWYIGNYVWMDPTNIDPIVLGTAAAEGAAETWATDVEYTTHTWTLTNAQIQDFNGQYVRPLIAFSNTPDADTYVRGRIVLGWGGGSDLLVYIADAVRSFASSVLDVGAFPIPPRGYTAGNNAVTKFQLTMQKPGGDTLTVQSVHFMPSGDGLFRRVRLVGTAWLMETGDAFVDDGIENVPYIVNAAAAAFPLLKAYGQPIHLWPGRVNRLRIVAAGNPWAVSEPWTATAWYRPRRITI